MHTATPPVASRARRRIPSPQGARRPGAFYGWWMVAACTLVRGFTAPGQTVGISAFIDDIIDSLGTTRSAVATAYLIGTLTGATVLTLVGRWVDRVGVRRAMLFVSSLFGAAILFTSTVQNIVMLTIAFVGLRMLGQGSLHLVAVQGVVMWFERRRGFALAVSGMGTLVLMSSSPLVFIVIKGWVGWRWSFVVLGVGLLAVVVPLAWRVIVDRPEDIDQVPDGGSEPTDIESYRGRSFTVGEALRVPAFWTLGGLAVMAGAVVTGLTFHNIDLLGERGFSEAQAAAIFLPQMVGGSAASFGLAWLTDRVSARPLLFASGVFLALATVMASVATPGWTGVAYGALTGMAGGSTAAITSALLPKWFGVDHIGAIKGISTTMNVGASAVGPLVLSLGNDAAASYRPVVLWCAAACAAMALVALVVPTPTSV